MAAVFQCFHHISIAPRSSAWLYFSLSVTSWKENELFATHHITPFSVQYLMLALGMMCVCSSVVGEVGVLTEIDFCSFWGGNKETEHCSSKEKCHCLLLSNNDYDLYCSVNTYMRFDLVHALRFVKIMLRPMMNDSNRLVFYFVLMGDEC